MSQQINDLRAKYNTGGNAVIPNTFQHPNIFIDKLMYYLSPTENVVLTFAVRRILGFQSNIMSRKDNISLSQFTDGIIAEDGRALSMGCGIGLDATIKALEALSVYKILLPVTDKPDPRKGQEYWLQDNENAIDWDGLQKRKDDKKAVSYKQTQKARYSVKQKARGTVEQNSTPPVEQKATPLLDRDTKPTENTEETNRNPILAPNGANEVPFSFGVDWQMSGGNEVIVIQENDFENKARSWADLIGMNNTDLIPMAFEFMVSANKIPTDEDIKFWRSSFRKFKKMNANADTIRRAVTKHNLAKLTIKSPKSIEWAIGEIINPTPQDQFSPLEQYAKSIGAI